MFEGDCPLLVRIGSTRCCRKAREVRLHTISRIVSASRRSRESGEKPVNLGSRFSVGLVGTNDPLFREAPGMVAQLPYSGRCRIASGKRLVKICRGNVQRIKRTAYGPFSHGPLPALLASAPGNPKPN